MVRLLVGLLVLCSAAAHAFDACTAYNPSDGIVCTMPADGVTTGVCAGNVCTRNYTIPGNAARTGTGTISSSGSITVTGVGTAFTTELHVGDVITASGQRVSIATITNDTILSTDPKFLPSITAGTAFTYTNPIVRWVDENGNTVAILDSRGLVAFGQAFARGSFVVLGPTETADGAVGKPIVLNAGNGGPASSSVNAGAGAVNNLSAGVGGNSAITARSGGTGGSWTFAGGTGGVNTASGGAGGLGGYLTIQGGAGGPTTASGTGTTGGAGNDLTLVGGAGGPGDTAGAGGKAIVRGGSGASVGPVVLCDSGGLIKAGTSAQTQVDCSTGDITKIKNVPVAGMWNVNAFQQANAGGM